MFIRSPLSGISIWEEQFAEALELTETLALEGVDDRNAPLRLTLSSF